MGTIAKEGGSGGGFSPLPAGSYAAVCDQVIDLGIQPGGQYDPKQKVYIRWQVPGERVKWNDQGVEREGPAVIGRTFTLSLSEKSMLRPFLESWRGRAFTRAELNSFDVKAVLGAPCLISVIHETGRDGRDYARVTSAMQLPKGSPKPELEGEALHYDCDSPDPRTLAKLSPKIRERIEGRLNVEEAIQEMVAPQGQQEFDDDIPF